LIVFAEESDEKSQGNRKNSVHGGCVQKHLMAAVCIDTGPVITKDNHEKLHDKSERLIGRLFH
jgi:hypothetical protein